MGNGQTAMYSYNTQTRIYLSLSTKYTVSIIKMSSVKMLSSNSCSVCFCMQHFQQMKKQTMILANAAKPFRLIRNINALISAYFCTTR